MIWRDNILVKDYHTENRPSTSLRTSLTGVSGAASARFVYDGDGNRVKATIGGVTTAYIGNYFEWTGSTSTMIKYYYAGNTRAAMRVGSSNPEWLLSDHLGSQAITASYDGLTEEGELRYKSWGETRFSAGTTPTKRRYTGQYDKTGTIGLYFYGVRFFDPALSRFTSADSIIPGAGDVQTWDRYAAMMNNPLTYTDPTGHDPCTGTHGTYQPDCGVDGWYATSPDVWTESEIQQTKDEFKSVGGAATTVASVLFEPVDWATTAKDCLSGNCSPLVLLGFLPIIPSSVAHKIDEVITNRAAGNAFRDEIADVFRKNGYGVELEVVRKLLLDVE